MTTKTFHDIFDLVEMVSRSQEAKVEVFMQDGQMFFSVTNFTKDGDAYKAESLYIEGDSIVRAYHENVDAAFRAVEAKLASGEWEKSNACA